MIASEGNNQYYYDNYFECRKAFLAATKGLADRFSGVEAHSITVESAQTAEELTIDSCWVPAQVEQKKLFVITSGEHGVEGFVGSALQIMLMQEQVKNIEWDSTSLLIIHGVNPWGFLNRRRVTENNVDLNRNFFSKDEISKFKNPAYEKLVNLLNPAGQVKTSVKYVALLMYRFIRLARKLGLRTVRETTLMGQKQFPQGLFFCGERAEPQVAELIQLIVDKSRNCDQLLHLSLHTGFGERGKMHLIQPVNVQDKEHEELMRVYEGYKINHSSDEDFYHVFGGFQSYLNSQLKSHTSYLPMTLEFGTVNNQTLIGGLRSLLTMIRESQGYFHGFATKRDQETVHSKYLELYCPSSPTWRAKVNQETIDLFTKIEQRWL